MNDHESPDHEDVFDLDRLRELIELMKCHDLSEVDLQQAEQRIRLRRQREADKVSGPPPAAAPPPQVAAPLDAAAESAAAARNAAIVTIDSPMVGTFYSRANPDAEPFVKVGDHVGPETIVCIIEAMKVFNEIPADVSGKVVAMLAENEESVDFGRPLFRIDTSN